MQKGLNAWQQDTLKDVQKDMVELRQTNIEMVNECFEELIATFDQLDNTLEVEEIDVWHQEIEDIQHLLDKMTRG